MRTLSRREGWSFLTVCLMGIGISAARAQDTSYWCISKDLLDRAGLTLVWQEALPVKQGETLDVMTLLGDRLYVRSDRNYTWSLDRNDGNTVFSRSIAPAGFPILGWTVYEDRLICVIDNRLVELDIHSGRRQRASDLDVSIVAPPVRNGTFFYVSGADRRLHAFRARDMVRLFQASAENDSLITTVLADDQTVVFGTDAGNLIAITPDGPKKLWGFKAVEAISGPAIRDGNSYFFANRDTNVYRVDAAESSRATLVWKYQAEAVLDRAPRVTNTAVYQYALGRGLTAIDKESGKALWTLREGMDLLAESAGRAYVITKNNTMAVMDNAAGRRLYWVNVSPVVNHAANTTDARIYIADTQGRIACLEPTR